MLLVATGVSLIPAPLLWIFSDRIDAAALDTFGITDFVRYAVPSVLMIPALLVGWVAGFLMLEDRDDGPLMALDVTPAGKLGFIAYRLVAAALIAAAITLGAIALIAPTLPIGIALLVALLIGATAATFAAILPAVARNKVEGMALSKLTNIAVIVPLLALVPSPLRYLAGFIPTYWIGELLLPVAEPMAVPLAIGLAVATHAAAVIGLLWLLNRRIG